MGIVASTKDVRLQKVVDEQLNTMQLESTPIPFFPVATNARTMGPALPIGRTVGYGVQASSALPFVFRSPDDEETGVRFLDGAFVANVPGDLLVGCDTSLIIACNPVSPPLWWAEHRDTLEVIDEARKALPRELSRVVQRAASYGQILEWGRLVPASRPLRGKSGIPGRPLIRLGRFALAGLARLLSRHPTGLDALRGLQSLLSSLGDQSASSADVLIKPEMTITTAARFWRGEDIIEVVRAQLRQNGDIARVQAEWNRLKRSSVERTTPPAAGGSA
jgi:predicted acylesterase/phospholipase RssA